MMTLVTWVGLAVCVLLALAPLFVSLWVEHTDTGLRAAIWWRNFTRPLSPRASRWRSRPRR